MAWILIVEDDPTNAAVMERVLTRLGGHEVSVSEEAHEALAVCEAGADLVVMDVSLSNTHYSGVRIDGPALTRLMRERMGEEMPPVLLLTAHAMRGDRERLLQLSGADAYAPKPIMDHHEFVALVRALLNAAAERKVA